jgi:hypothetical protein
MELARPKKKIPRPAVFAPPKRGTPISAERKPNGIYEIENGGLLTRDTLAEDSPK